MPNPDERSPKQLLQAEALRQQMYQVTRLQLTQAAITGLLAAGFQGFEPTVPDVLLSAEVMALVAVELADEALRCLSLSPPDVKAQLIRLRADAEQRHPITTGPPE